MSQRAEVVTEIIESERSYVSSLQVLLEVTPHAQQNRRKIERERKGEKEKESAYWIKRQQSILQGLRQANSTLTQRVNASWQWCTLFIVSSSLALSSEHTQTHRVREREKERERMDTCVCMCVCICICVWCKFVSVCGFFCFVFVCVCVCVCVCCLLLCVCVWGGGAYFLLSF